MSLPEKARVTLRFDDGFLDIFTNAKPIMDSAGFVGTSFIVTDWANTSGHMSTAQLQALQSAGWEIGSHSVTHVTLTTVNEARQIDELEDSKSILESWGLNIRSFAPPANGWNSALAVLAQNAGYESVSTGYMGSPPYYQAWPPADLYDMKRGPSINSIAHTAADVLGWVDTAISAKEWQILLFHNVRDAVDNYSTNLAMFQDIVGGLKSRVINGDLEIVTQHGALQLPPTPEEPVLPLPSPLGTIALRGPSGVHTLARARLSDAVAEYDVDAFRSPFGTKAHRVGTTQPLSPIRQISGVIERADIDAAADALAALLHDLPALDRMGIGIWTAKVNGAAGAVVVTPTLRGWSVTFGLVETVGPWVMD
jgi:peptidoglycan/xylan/chitin deacetylase (PgdA/CDA1 family)